MTVIRSGYKLPPVIIDTVKDLIDVQSLNGYQRFMLLKAITGYVLSLHDFVEIKRCLTTFMDRREAHRIGSSVRIAAIHNFDLIVRFKQATYVCLRDHIYKRHAVHALFRDFGLTDKDANLYFYLHDLELYEPAQEKLKTAVYAFVHPDRVRHHCSRMVKYLHDTAHVIKFVKAKHSFIVKHNNFKEEDVINDLLMWGIAAFYQSIPFRPYLHTINFVKQTIHNRGINEIEKYTAQKRSRLSKDGVKEVSLSSENENSEAYEKDVSDSEKISDNEDDMLLKISVTALLKKYDKNKRKVIKLLMSRNLKSFLDYVIEREGKYFDTVQEYRNFCKTEEIFLEVVREFVGAPEEGFYKFIKDLRQKLGEELV